MQRWTYDVRVVGTVSDEVLAAVQAEFGDVAAVLEPPSTLIRSTVPDQAALIGMLTQLQGLGLNIYEVRRDADPDPDA